MSDKDCDFYDERGRKVGTIRRYGPFDGCLGLVLFVVFIIVLGVIVTQCSVSIKSKKASEALQRDFLSLTYIDDCYNKYDYNQIIDVDLNYEKEWMKENYPDIEVYFLGNTWGPELSESSGTFSLDSWHSYTPANDGVLFGYNMKSNEKFQSFTSLSGTVNLDSDYVKEWLGSDKREDDIGLLIVFIDNQVVYKSSILDVNGLVSEEFYVDIQDADEVTICLIGTACLQARFLE